MDEYKTIQVGALAEKRLARAIRRGIMGAVWRLLLVYVLYVVVQSLFYFSVGGPERLTVLVDRGTGCQYVVSGDGMMPRMTLSGEHICWGEVGD